MLYVSLTLWYLAARFTVERYLWLLYVGYCFDWNLLANILSDLYVGYCFDWNLYVGYCFDWNLLANILSEGI